MRLIVLVWLALLAAAGVSAPAAAQELADRPYEAFRPLDLPTPNERRLGSGAPGPAYWQQRVDYRIDATLDPGARRLEADMEVTYYNNSPHALTYLWLQLEQNLFRQDSIGTRTRTGGGPMRAMEEPFDGGYDIPAIRAGGRELDFAVYDTLCRVELPAPIEPGGTFRFELAFAFDMPPYLRRMGAEDVEQGRIFEYAQWFPHVCNYDDVNGWNTLPYLGTGEFYTNFGDYEVSLTVPRSYLVAASGVLQNPQDVLTETQRRRLARARDSRQTVPIRTPEEVGDPASRPAGQGPLTWRFRGENIRTFAWAASDAFIWDACGVRVPERDGAERVVLCQSLYPREAIGTWGPDADKGGSTQYVAHSVDFYSDFLLPYPYPVMTNVNGPEGGMEYPMIIFCGGREGRGPLWVTDHEVGHTWFPMVINTDERRHAWMDEGFNTFINMHAIADFAGEPINPGRAMRQTMRLARGPSQPIATYADRILPGLLGSTQYRKTALGLHLLREAVLGPERFDTAFREYARRWAFKSPQPADFFRTMEDAAGADLAWFFRQWFLEDGVLDQGVEVELPDPAAADLSEDPPTDDQANTDDANADDATTGEPQPRPARVAVLSLADQVMPAVVRLEFADGTADTRRLPVQTWATTRRRVLTVPLDGRQLVRVVVDPAELLPDVNRSNNTWTAPDHQPADGGAASNDSGR